MRPAKRRSRASTATRWSRDPRRRAPRRAPSTGRRRSRRHGRARLAKPGDFVVCLGAGTITQWAYALPKELGWDAGMNRGGELDRRAGRRLAGLARARSTPQRRDGHRSPGSVSAGRPSVLFQPADEEDLAALPEGCVRRTCRSPSSASARTSWSATAAFPACRRAPVGQGLRRGRRVIGAEPHPRRRRAARQARRRAGAWSSGIGGFALLPRHSRHASAARCG